MNELRERLVAFSTLLSQLNADIKKVTLEYEQLALSEVVIRHEGRLIGLHSRYDQHSELANDTPTREHHAEAEYITELLQNKGMAMTLNELVNIVQQNNPSFIPIQIINLKGYLARKLKKACAEGRICQEATADNNTRLYGLKEWIGPGGWMRNEYLPSTIL